jgi:hypothetical protein
VTAPVSPTRRILDEKAAEQDGGVYGAADAYCDGMTVVGGVGNAVDVTVSHDPATEFSYGWL